MEYAAGIGGGGGGSGSDHHDAAAHPQRSKKRYHRHTAYQIQKLEAMFQDFPHPDEKQRMQLSRELSLAPRQIKFWFQNRRTQMKAQHERSDNCALRVENDRIRCENIAIREALKNVICPSCGVTTSVGEDPYFDEQKLRMENAQLKEELDRVSGMAAKYIGRPFSQLPPVQPIQTSSLDLSMAIPFGVAAGPSLDLDLDLLVRGSSSTSTTQNMPFQAISVTEMDKSLMADIAGNAMDEFIRLLQNDEPLWIKSTNTGRDILNLDTYERLFPRSSGKKNPNIRIETSRDSGVIIMNGLTLVDMFMDCNKWVELFPTIISRARTLELISSSSGILGIHTSSLQLMYEELQVLSPLVPTRQFYLLRACQQLEQGSWAIVNVSYDHLPQEFSQSADFKLIRCHKLPSGCLIQDMPNGYSKVTWVEHVEIEDKSTPVHGLCGDLLYSGHGFGAERWLATLQRMCERFACLMVTGNSTRDLGGVIPSPEGRRSMMKLAQRMVNNFCGSFNSSNGHQWTTVCGSSEVEVRASFRKSSDPGQPPGVVVSAATTIWLPVSHQNVFNFFRDERTRPQWDVLFNGNAVQEVAHIANGSHPGNCISVLRALNTSSSSSSSQNNMLILQESCTDSSGSLVVYCPVDLPAINMAMSGEDPSYIPLLSSGFSILPDGNPGDGGGDGVILRASTSTCSTSTTHGSTAGTGTGGGGGGGGSLVTVVFQILVSSLPISARMNPESVATVNNLISTTVQQIKAALNCHSTTSLSS